MKPNRFNLIRRYYTVRSELKTLILLTVPWIIWASIPSALAQNKNWIRIDSIKQIEEIRSPAIGVISRTYVQDIFLIQAEIVRRNALRTEAISLYEIDATKLDEDELKLVFKSDRHLRLPEIVVYNDGEWIMVKFFERLTEFFRKNPLQDAHRFHQQIAEVAFEIIAENPK